MTRFRRLVSLLVLLPVVSVTAGFFGSSGKAQSVAEPEGYRMNAFRAPVPETLQGAKVVSNREAADLHAAGKVIFIDVLPRPPKPPKLPEDVVWRPRARNNIPGSIWLPNVGFGALNPEVEHYFRSNLERLTSGDKSVALLLYCQAECWMSWNAAKRAVSYGYSSIYWYPEGTDGWMSLGGDLEPSEPVPMAR